MKAKHMECLEDRIGFISEAHKEAYGKIIRIGDVISNTSRELDMATGGMTAFYLSIVGDDQHNDLLHESYKHFLNQCQQIVERMITDIRKIEESRDGTDRKESFQSGAPKTNSERN